jgi:hypothetical protein
MTFIDSPLQPAYEPNLMCEMRAQAPKCWYSLYQHVTDFHFVEVKNAFHKNVREMQRTPQWSMVVNALWTDVS